MSSQQMSQFSTRHFVFEASESVDGYMIGSFVYALWYQRL